jgi:hypothetical protein
MRKLPKQEFGKGREGGKGRGLPEDGGQILDHPSEIGKCISRGPLSGIFALLRQAKWGKGKKMKGGKTGMLKGMISNHENSLVEFLPY